MCFLSGMAISEPVTVFLIEASEEVGALLSGFLSSSGRIRMLGSANDQSGAMQEIQRLDPDVVVVDAFPRAELSAGGRTLVIYATTIPNRSVVELHNAGVSDVVLKEAGSLDGLIAAIVRASTS